MLVVSALAARKAQGAQLGNRTNARSAAELGRQVQLAEADTNPRQQRSDGAAGGLYRLSLMLRSVISMCFTFIMTGLISTDWLLPRVIMVILAANMLPAATVISSLL